MRNPFKPTFGATPPRLVGRSDLIREFADALDDGPGAPGRATLYTGARGAGKTVLLNAVEEEARRRGWLVVSETAAPGLVERLTRSRLPELLQRFDPEAVGRRLSGFTAPFGAGGLTWETIERHVVEHDLRAQTSLLTDLQAAGETGLLITVDEVHRRQTDELRELATVVQHAFREERELAFAGAGLSATVSDLLADEVLTFLRRADRHHLGPVSIDETRRALREPIREGGREVSGDALELMVEGTHGYPFLIQLVGSSTWRVRRDAAEITLPDARAGVVEARRRLGTLVHAPAVAGISDVDRAFLVAMSRDEGPSRTADLVERLAVPKGYVNVYRRRLIDAELIDAPRRGYVEFALPYLREYVREHLLADA